MNSTRRVLGVDPGYDRLGLAILEGDPSKPTLVWSDCVTPAKGLKEARLAEVGRAVEKAIEEFAPDVIALETLFFSTNVKTALGVAEARGVILATCGAHHLPVQEYSPQSVKLAVTGYGAADKKAVTAMIPRLVTFTKPLAEALDDELDAIAVAIAGLADRAH